MSTEKKDTDEVVELINSLIRGDCQGKKTLKGILWEPLAKQIKRILQDRNARHHGRVAIVGNMKERGLTDEQIFHIVHANNKWDDYDEAKTQYQISTIHATHTTASDKIQDAQDITQRATDTPTPDTQGTAQDIEILIYTIPWRKPDVLPSPASIRHFFMNRCDVFAVQHAPTGENKGWHYRPVRRELTDKDIYNHLETWLNPQCADPFTTGTYEKDINNKGKWLCFDIDHDDQSQKENSNNRNAALLLCGFFEYHEVNCLLENASEGFESYHVWVFCEPTDIRTLQAIGKYAAQQTQVKCEVYPKSSHDSDFGNLVRLPFSLNRKRKAKSKIIPYNRNHVIALYRYMQALLPIHA